MNKPVKISESISADPCKAFKAAVRTAMNILAYKDNTVNTLRKKLFQRGYPAKIVEEAVAYMLEKGYLDEERSMIRAVQYLANTKLYAEARIRAELSAKGFSGDTIATLDFSREELCDIDFTENCRRLLQKRGGILDNKNYVFLRRYGYTSSDIRKAADFGEK